MRKEIIIRGFAELDLAEAWDFYRSHKPGLEEDLVIEIRKCFEKIQQSPAMFPIVHKQCRRAFLVSFPLSIIFRENADAIMIVAIFHSSRDPDVWKQRIS